ncbi:unnamed protein product [Urochloa humidicola]
MGRRYRCELQSRALGVADRAPGGRAQQPCADFQFCTDILCRHGAAHSQQVLCSPATTTMLASAASQATSLANVLWRMST